MRLQYSYNLKIHSKDKNRGFISLIRKHGHYWWTEKQYLNLEDVQFKEEFWQRFTTIKRNYSLQALIYVIYSCTRSSLLYTYMYSSIQRKPGDKVQCYCLTLIFKMLCWTLIYQKYRTIETWWHYIQYTCNVHHYLQL